MIVVRIAELKAHLSKYLRLVRNGRTVTVLDRETPIAQIVPSESDSYGLAIRRARGKISFGRVPLPHAAKVERDVVQLLLDDRRCDE